MSIHTLHDLCYAYNVADPVREMLFALQDRIDELEKQLAVQTYAADNYRRLLDESDHAYAELLEQLS